MNISTKLKIKELLRKNRWTTKVLAEKTGMSESYLTHIKNGTRRWNEDALAKLAEAFEIHPTELFDDQTHLPNLESPVNLVNSNELSELSEKTDIELNIIPILTKIPSQPNTYNNRVLQLSGGTKEDFMLIIGKQDPSMFCYQIQDSSYTPTFAKKDLLVISPESWSKTGDIVAAEYNQNNQKTKVIAQISYIDDLIILESINHKSSPIALIKGKDDFKIIGKVIERRQRLSV